MCCSFFSTLAVSPGFILPLSTPLAMRFCWFSARSPTLLIAGLAGRAALFSRAVWIGRQICWPRRELLRVLLNFLHHHLDGFLELRIVSGHHFVRRVVNDDVGLHAVVFD